MTRRTALARKALQGTSCFASLTYPYTHGPELGFAVVDVLSCAAIDGGVLMRSFRRSLAAAEVGIRVGTDAI